MKSHFDPPLPINNGELLFTCYRDLRAVVGSMVRMRWLADDPDQILNWCEGYTYVFDLVSEKASYIMRYEDYLDDPSREVIAMGRILGFEEESATAAMAEVEALEPPIYGSTEEGLSPLEANPPISHIGGRFNAKAVANLSRSSIEAIERVYADWLLKYNYPARFDLDAG